MEEKVSIFAHAKARQGFRSKEKALKGKEKALKGKEKALKGKEKALKNRDEILIDSRLTCGTRGGLSYGSDG
ncbi:MAG: hypothetical protein SOW44_01890 [Porphyromonas sp.]|nr:hypothetical protein [Porphyromonas sp.]